MKNFFETIKYFLVVTVMMSSTLIIARAQFDCENSSMCISDINAPASVSSFDVGFIPVDKVNPNAFGYQFNTFDQYNAQLSNPTIYFENNGAPSTSVAPQQSWDQSSISAYKSNYSNSSFNTWDTGCDIIKGCGTVTQTPTTPNVPTNSSYTCSNGKVVTNTADCPSWVPTTATTPSSAYVQCPGSELYMPDLSECPTTNPLNQPSPTTNPGNVTISIDNSTTVVGGYPLVSTGWSGNYGWATYPRTYYATNWSSYPQTNYVTPATTITTVTKYLCPDGTTVTNANNCPAGTCANGALDYPTCQVLKKCVNGAINYSACDKCPTNAEIYDNGTNKVCVAMCDSFSMRATSTGSCVLKPCTNGSDSPPFCKCPAAKSDIVNGQCTIPCPGNTYRTDAGCVAYQCKNGAIDYPNCVSCPTGKYPQAAGCLPCPDGTSWNGSSCIKNACTNNAINYPDCNLCVTGMDYVASLKTCRPPCGSGYTRNATNGGCDLINTQCNNNALNYPACTQCPVGYDPITTGNTLTCMTGCPTGYNRVANGACTISTIMCPSGVTVSANQSCPPIMRPCDNGSFVSYYSACPISTYNTPVIITQPSAPITAPSAGGTPVNAGNIQYKQCPNGQNVALNSICPFTTNNVNSVNTTHISNISNKSMVCNGVANVYANMQSYGWIEWGADAMTLNKRTPTQFIGRDSVITFSAPMTNLSPNNIYYCRAVMANNMGTYKGDIIHAATVGSAVTYATAKVEKVTTTKNNIKQVKVVTPVYACKDAYGNKATVLGGEKMLTLSIDKSSTIYAKGDKVNYTISYKNTSKVAVKNVEIKLNFPKEIINIKATKGDISGNDIVYKIDELGPKGEGVILVDGEVGDVELGRNLTVAGVVGYDIPSKDNLRDEVSAINVGSVKATDTAPKVSTGKAKVVATGNSFLPHTLIGWAIIILVIFIIVVGWRAWKAKREDSHH